MIEKISIIIPIYNTAEYLAACLDSVLGQSYADWECLLIDDGSTDGSAEIAEDYAARDVRFQLFRQEHRGVSYAVQNGVEHATGEWLYFLDSDDWIDAEELEFLHGVAGRDGSEMVTSCFIMEPEVPTPVRPVDSENQVQVVKSRNLAEKAGRKEKAGNDGASQVAGYPLQSEDLKSTGPSAPCLTQIVHFEGTVDRENFPQFYDHLLRGRNYSQVVCGNSRGAKLTRADLVRKNVYRTEGMVWGEDAVLSLAAMLDCRRITGLPEHAGYHYRQRGASSTKNYGREYVHYRIEYVERMRELCAARELFDDETFRKHFNVFEFYTYIGSLNYQDYDVTGLFEADRELEQVFRTGLLRLPRAMFAGIEKKLRLVAWLVRLRQYRLIRWLYRLDRLVKRKRAKEIK